MPPITENTPVRFSDPLPDAIDVVVIGAGVAGTATAYFLAQRGQKVLLCEKGRVAGEQSSPPPRSTMTVARCIFTAIRAQPGAPGDVRFTPESRHAWQLRQRSASDPKRTSNGFFGFAQGQEWNRRYEKVGLLVIMPI